jgi:hypothetical protein
LTPEEAEGLDLLCFRYVAGELSPDEARDLEARLADDQAAREAVNRAVGLAQCLVEAGSLRTPEPAAAPQPAVLPLAPVRRNPLVRVARALSWMAAGAAATLLIVALTERSHRPPTAPSGSAGPQAPQSQPAADALVWARLHSSQGWATEELQRWVDDAAPPLEEPRDGAPSAQLPSWVFAANPRLEENCQP